MTKEDMKNEIYFYLAVKLLDEMLENALINEEEYDKMKLICIEKYSPYLGELMG